ncbi:hypothetical protein HSBAA_34760 [Vreelandella sulfidaeris]|uniref:3-hydroxyacyl-CoA dehydrogenase NAD binding domain-containing protein n=1 Tax=Vreelandella sulfidaeris TaxID=115553 RepID=A0A455U7N1_9GAMM|nr:hypothetical protein HSBAA_34760 [Halomonas sulfidaeris]
MVEAIVEKLEAKQGLFSDLEGIVSQDAVLATNTSSLLGNRNCCCLSAPRASDWLSFL